MKKKIIAHLKGDIKNFKKESSEDKALIKKIKHEKHESKKHEKKEHKKKHAKKKIAKKVHHKKKHHSKKSSKFKSKVEKVMHEFKEGALHSGSKKGPKVINPKQAIAISLSEARKASK